jgi:hypothetical protein
MLLKYVYLFLAVKSWKIPLPYLGLVIFNCRSRLKLIVQMINLWHCVSSRQAKFRTYQRTEYLSCLGEVLVSRNKWMWGSILVLDKTNKKSLEFSGISLFVFNDIISKYWCFNQEIEHKLCGTLYKFENIANKFNSHRLQTNNHYPIWKFTQVLRLLSYFEI